MGVPIIDVKRDGFIFKGHKAEDSAKFYDIVISHGYKGDKLTLARESAHKFGSDAICPGIASFRHGLKFGDKAEEAAAYFNSRWKKAFGECEQENRRAKMRVILHELLQVTETEFGVRIEVTDWYYY